MTKEEKRQLIRNECKARGIAIYQRGLAYWLVAPGVDIKVVDLAELSVASLDAYQPVHAD